jgi:hypothetical protein
VEAVKRLKWGIKWKLFKASFRRRMMANRRYARYVMRTRSSSLWLPLLARRMWEDIKVNGQYP